MSIIQATATLYAKCEIRGVFDKEDTTVLFLPQAIASTLGGAT